MNRVRERLVENALKNGFSCDSRRRSGISPRTAARASGRSRSGSRRAAGGSDRTSSTRARSRQGCATSKPAKAAGAPALVLGRHPIRTVDQGKCERRPPARSVKSLPRVLDRLVARRSFWPHPRRARRDRRCSRFAVAVPKRGAPGGSAARTAYSVMARHTHSGLGVRPHPRDPARLGDQLPDVRPASIRSASRRGEQPNSSSPPSPSSMTSIPSALATS